MQLDELVSLETRVHLVQLVPPVETDPQVVRVLKVIKDLLVKLVPSAIRVLKDLSVVMVQWALRVCEE